MEQLFNIDLEKIPVASEQEKQDRKKNLQLFFETGLPNKKNEDWKFTDLDSIIKKNFKSVKNNYDFNFERKIDIISEFEHNYILLVNGIYKSSDIKFEENDKIFQ